MLGKCTRGKQLKGSQCPTQAIPVYTCHSVSRPCEALTRNLLKSKSHSLIFIAPERSAHACTACVGGGNPAPQACTGVRGLVTHVFNHLSTASELQRYSQSLLNKNKPSQTNRGSSVKQRIALVAGGHICANSLDCHRQPLSNFIHVHVLRKGEFRSRLVQPEAPGPVSTSSICMAFQSEPNYPMSMARTQSNVKHPRSTGVSGLAQTWYPFRASNLDLGVKGHRLNPGTDGQSTVLKASTENGESEHCQHLVTTKGNGHLTEYIPRVNSWTGISGFLVVSMHRHRGKRRSQLATGISTNKASGTDGVSATQASFVMRARSANTHQ